MRDLFHRMFTGHWPFYQHLGYDKWQFDLYGDECLVCKKR